MSSCEVSALVGLRIPQRHGLSVLCFVESKISRTPWGHGREHNSCRPLEWWAFAWAVCSVTGKVEAASEQHVSCQFQGGPKICNHSEWNSMHVSHVHRALLYLDHCQWMWQCFVYSFSLAPVKTKFVFFFFTFQSYFQLPNRHVWDIWLFVERLRVYHWWIIKYLRFTFDVIAWFKQIVADIGEKTTKDHHSVTIYFYWYKPYMKCILLTSIVFSASSTGWYALK